MYLAPLGLKLEKADGQRRRIKSAIELLSLVEVFEKISSSTYDLSGELSEKELRSLLPSVWESQSWGDIARALQGLKSALTGINSEEAKIAPVFYSSRSRLEIDGSSAT